MAICPEQNRLVSSENRLAVRPNRRGSFIGAYHDGPVQGRDEKLLNISLVKTFQSEFSAVAEWIDGYLSDARAYPVLSQVQPGEVAAQLPECAPEEGEPFAELMADFERIVLPGITHWNSPRFFAYFATSAAPVAVAAEALAAALDVKAMLWRTSPSATEFEEVVMRWLARLMGLPDAFTGIIYDTASIGGFTALAAARESLDLGIREHGMSGRDLPRPARVHHRTYAFTHRESVHCAGRGTRERRARRLRRPIIECRRRISRHASMPTSRRECGRWPSSRLRERRRPRRAIRSKQIASVARERNVWLHVDAAYAGVAAIMPEFRWVLAGAELADSIVVNPHKWLFVPMDCSALYVRDLELLRRTFSLVPEYLRTPEESVRNYMDYGLQLGRRFRALKLWFVLRHFGAQGLRERLRGHIALAQEFASWIRAEPGWEVLAPHPLSVVCFRCAPPGRSEAEVETLNAAIMERVNATGEIFLSHTKLGGTLRAALGDRESAHDARGRCQSMGAAARYDCAQG